MKKIVTKTMSYLLTAAMIVGSISLSPMATVEVSAAEATVKNVNLNTGGGTIAGIVKGQDRTGSLIYFGSKGDPILWRTMSTDSPAAAATGTITLLADDKVVNMRRYDPNSHHRWCGTPPDFSDASEICRWLNGYNDYATDGFLPSRFTDIEKDSIQQEYSTAQEQGARAEDTFTPNQPIVLPSKSEAIEWFSNGTNRKLNGSIRWWSRTPGGDDTSEDTHVLYVANDGGISEYGWPVSKSNITVRPALKLELSSVLFSSANKPTDFEKTTDGSAIDTWKLTLKDGNSTFAASRTDAGDLASGTSVTVDITGFGSKSSSDYDKLSAMLVDSNNTVLAYGPTNCTVSEGEKTFTIPTYTGTASKLYIFGEKLSGGNLTDYASNMVELVHPNPTVTSVTVAPLDVSVQKGTSQTFTATVSGNYDPAQTVTWTVEGKNSNHTSITDAGVLSVGSDETAASLTVRATSTVDTAKSGTATVNVSVPSAAISDVTVNGVTGTSITEKDITISLTNAKFSEIAANTDVSDWFTNKPTGISAKIKNAVDADATSTVVTIYGTPGTASNSAMDVTINSNLQGGGSVSDGGSTTLSATANKGYKFVKWLKGDSVVSTSASYEVTNVTEDAEYIAVFKKKASAPKDDEDDEEESRPSDNHSRTQQPPQDILQFTYSADLVNAKVFKAKQGPLCELAFRMATPAGYQEAFSFNLFLTGKAMYEPKQKTLTLTIPEMYRKSGRKFAIIGVDQNGAARIFTDSDFIDSTITIQMDGFEGFAFSVIYTDVK